MEDIDILNFVLFTGSWWKILSCRLAFHFNKKYNQTTKLEEPGIPMLHRIFTNPTH
jgi:hypothetical protein